MILYLLEERLSLDTEDELSFDTEKELLLDEEEQGSTENRYHIDLQTPSNELTTVTLSDSNGFTDMMRQLKESFGEGAQVTTAREGRINKDNFDGWRDKALSSRGAAGVIVDDSQEEEVGFDIFDERLKALQASVESGNDESDQLAQLSSRIQKYNRTLPYGFDEKANLDRLDSTIQSMS
jgi:hypothetical protein